MVSRPLPRMFQKNLVFHGCSHVALVAGISMFLVTVPYQRLTGFYENGLRWKKPEQKLKKFDFTSEFEKQSMWRHFVVDPKSD